MPRTSDFYDANKVSKSADERLYHKQRLLPVGLRYTATNFAGTAMRGTAQQGNPWHVRDRA